MQEAFLNSEKIKGQRERQLVSASFQEFFKESVVATLSRVLGESATHSLLYHINFDDRQTPKEFHERLVAMMGDGASTLERSIVKEMFVKLVAQSPHVNPDFDFEVSVRQAREVYVQRYGSS